MFSVMCIGSDFKYLFSFKTTQSEKSYIDIKKNDIQSKQTRNA